jgi:hypothetical protein
VELTVLPLWLDRPLSWGFFLYGWYPLETIPSYEAPLREMRRSGMTCCVISPMHFFHGRADVTGEDGNLRLDTTVYDRAMEVYQKVGFPDPPVVAAAPWVTQTIQAMGRSQDFPKTYSDYGYPQIDIESPDRVSPEIQDRLRWVLRRFYDHSLEQNWPRFYLYLVDEPSSGSPKMAHAKLLYRLVREVAPEMGTAGTLYTLDWWKELDGGLDLNVAHYVHPAGGPEGNRRWLDFAAQQNCTLFGIDFLGGAVDTFWDGRYVSLAAERAGLSGMLCWTQHTWEKLAGPLDPYFGVRSAWKGGPWWMVREEDGRRVLSVGWLGLREGIDDSRYYRTARALAAEAARSPDPAVRAAGEAAARRVQAILETWPWVRDARTDPTHHNSAAADRTRGQFAQVALEMQETLKNVRE